MNSLFQSLNIKDPYLQNLVIISFLITINDQELSTKIDAEITWVKVRYNSRISSRESKYMQPINRKVLLYRYSIFLRLIMEMFTPLFHHFFLMEEE